MDETRRSLIKGMLTSGTLLFLGIPKITEALSLNPSLSESTQNCQLLLGSTPIDEAFAKGAETACASYSDSHQGALPAFQLENELLINPLRIVDLLTQSCNIRWIAVMDDTNAAIFAELVRNSEGRLLALGSHTAVSNNNATLPLRHRWTTASPSYSAGGLLASMLIQNAHSFSIVENFLAGSQGNNAIKDASLSEFSSYHLVDQPAIHLHCAGVSLPEANQLIGWETSKNWESLFSRTAKSSIYPNKAASRTAIEHPQFDNWVEVTGYAIVTTALGMGINQEPCSSRAFVHRSDQRYPDHHKLSEKHFVTFVIDV